MKVDRERLLQARQLYNQAIIDKHNDPQLSASRMDGALYELMYAIDVSPDDEAPAYDEAQLKEVVATALDGLGQTYCVQCRSEGKDGGEL